MADGRMLKRAVSDSRRLPELKTDSARLLWTWILPYLDVEGRYYADPELIKGHIVPRIKSFNFKNISEYLCDMARVGLIILYAVDGEKYLQFRNFKEYQNLRENREGKSKIPAPTPGVLPEYSNITPAQVKLREVNIPASEQLPPKKKIKFLDFVLLFEEEHKKLVSEFGESGCKQKIENLNLYIGSKGDKYKSHYHTILAWERKNNPTTETIDPIEEEYKRKYGHAPGELA